VEQLKNTAGFSYPAVLILIAVSAIFAQQAVKGQQLQARRHIENRIIAQGEAFIWAIESYWLAGQDEPTLPRNIDQLLNDQRHGGARHLRGDLTNPFPDGEWTLVLNADGLIIGTRLNSTRVPVKKVLVLNDGRSQKIKTYADWVFAYIPTIKPKT
jgi:hypothetical protein